MSQENHVSIPKIFYSDLTGAPLDRCISCDRELILSGRPYVIEKAIKPYQGYGSYSTIFEYAMCLTCADDMRQMISKESMQSINEYFMKNLDFTSRVDLDPMDADDSIDPWMKKCLVKGTGIEELGECQIYAQCIGDQLLVKEFPYMISGAVIDEVMQVLSAKTLEEFDRMKDELIDGPSEFQDLLKGGPRVFI